MNPPFEPAPEELTQPALWFCHVLPSLESVSHCKKPWDGKHTALGFALCAECYEAIRVS